MEFLPDLAFSVDPELCNRCGRCVVGCPAEILTLASEGPVQLIAEKSDRCYRCQHCLAVCPHAAIFILGHNPQASLLLAGNLPSPHSMEVLMRGRRSVRASSHGTENISAPTRAVGSTHGMESIFQNTKAVEFCRFAA